MTTDLSPVIVKKTQDTLGKFVKKPNLSDKLLRKPPFKFLHDVINVVFFPLIRNAKQIIDLYFLTFSGNRNYWFF